VSAANPLNRFTVAGQTIELPAVAFEPRAATGQLDAWLRGEWQTVVLTQELEALRVHSDGREIDGLESFMTGRWLAIGDVVLTALQYEANRTLLRRFTHVANVVLLPRTRLNIGIAGPLRDYPHPGGGWQAERLSDHPQPRYRPLVDAGGNPNLWHIRAGRA
jgi:hypothetical protein